MRVRVREEGKVQLENWKQAKGSCIVWVWQREGENKEMSANWANIQVSLEKRMLHKPHSLQRWKLFVFLPYRK